MTDLGPEFDTLTPLWEWELYASQTRHTVWWIELLPLNSNLSGYACLTNQTYNYFSRILVTICHTQDIQCAWLQKGMTNLFGKFRRGPMRGCDTLTPLLTQGNAGVTGPGWEGMTRCTPLVGGFDFPHTTHAHKCTGHDTPLKLVNTINENANFAVWGLNLWHYDSNWMKNLRS